MVNILQNPQYFYALDSVFEVVSVIASMFLSYYSWKVYGLTKQGKYKLMALAFLFMLLSFVVRIIANLAIHFQRETVQHALTISVATDIGRIYQLGLFFYRFIFLLGVVLLLMLALRVKNRTVFASYILFVVLFAYFSVPRFTIQSNLIYYVISSTLLFFVFTHFVGNFQSKKSVTSLLVAAAFFLLFISQGIFVPFMVTKGAYAVSKIFQLSGFLMLLFSYLLVLKK
jgi:hypothetical protein